LYQFKFEIQRRKREKNVFFYGLPPLLFAGGGKPLFEFSPHPSCHILLLLPLCVSMVLSPEQKLNQVKARICEEQRIRQQKRLRYWEKKAEKERAEVFYGRSGCGVYFTYYVLLSSSFCFLVRC
jgi:hypothetical protein